MILVVQLHHFLCNWAVLSALKKIPKNLNFFRNYILDKPMPL
jgi:hypothetical protein